MREEILMIGDVRAFNKPVVMKCYGLGTCVGLFVKDRLTGITGGAHIFLPEANTHTQFGHGASVADLVDQVLYQMKEKGASMDNLRAKIAGGSNPLMQFHEVGSRNTEEVINALVRNRVYIAAMDVGGSVSRTVKFNTESEQLVVRQLQWNSTKIF